MQYQAEEGMTWREFIWSQMNSNASLECSSDNVKLQGYEVTLNSIDVHPSDIILPVEYTVMYPGAGN